MTSKVRYGPVAIDPQFQHYDWGDFEFIPKLYGIEGNKKPYAEAWLGAHKTSPSSARAGNETLPLDRLIANDPQQFLGRECQSEFGELPYLVKVLSAARPLSIQVHPSRAQAVAGYRRENAAKIPFDSRHRNYRDQSHKPEILVALTRFWALCGFRPATEIAASLDHAGKIAQLLPPYDAKPGWLQRLVTAYFSLPDSEILPALTEWIEGLARSESAFGPDRPEHWTLQSHRLFSTKDRPDRGLFFALLLNLVVLEPWQALFLEAGTPHAYLSGSGIEVMANSDNVLRCGLTPKNVDVAEFLTILRFESAEPFVVRSPETTADGVAVYRTPAEEFQVERLSLAAGMRSKPQTARGPVLLMFLTSQSGARLTIDAQSQTLELGAAGSCLLADGTEYEFESDSAGELIRVVVPDRKNLEYRGSKPTRLAFGTSGLRGLVTDITDLEAYVNVRGFLDYLVETGDAESRGQVLLAGDLRPSTDSRDRSIMTAVACACVDAGFSVVNEGNIPTPALSYYAFQKRLPSIMVTGSHIPFDRNGIKFNKPDGELLKADELPVLKAVERSRRAEYSKPPLSSRFDDRGMFRSGQPMELPARKDDARQAYIKRYVDFFPAKALLGMRVVVYQHSAVGRDILMEILSDLGAEVHGMGRTETFVPIDTEAISEADLTKLSDFARTAREHLGPIDAIVSTDGDSDRPLIVAVGAEGKIRFIAGDLIGILVAQYLDADSIAVPVSATDAIDLAFANRPVELVRTRIGSPWVIAAMNEFAGKRCVGFEANGGFLVGSAIDRDGRTLEPLPTRDSVLPILAVLHAAREKSMSLWDLIETLPKRFGKSGLLDAVPSKDLAALAARFNADAAATDIAGVRAALEQHFHKGAGFGSIRNIDFRDGVRISFEGGDIAHVRASGNAPQLRIYAFADTEARAAEIVALSVREPDGILRSLLADAAQHEFSSAILRNIAHTEALFERGSPPKVIGTVCGSEAARRFWQHRLDEIQPAFKAREAISFHEDLPVNQAFGLLLLWHRLRDRLRPQEGALIAFVFGEGTRATPFTETDNGQKPAMSSFVKLGGANAKRYLSMVELGLKYFAPVEAYLRRSGFDGVVVKWGDEVQIATNDLSGTSPLFAGADIVRFVSKRTMTDFDAANKDWVGVDAGGHVTAFIPRRPLAQMRALAERGLIEQRGDALIAGINLGSIAVSRALLDELLAEFESEVLDPSADRARRPDLDPQFFSALTIAAIQNEEDRWRVWDQYRSELQSLRDLEKDMPDILKRLRGVLERFAARHGRPPRIVAMDFADQYWGDVGQHRQIFEFYLALNDRGASGTIARALAGLRQTRDANNNILVNSAIGEARVVNSVVIDCQIQSGEIANSILIGTRGGTLQVKEGFDIGSTVREMSLGRRAGAYKVVSRELVSAREGERITTLFLPDGRDVLMRVHEDTDLRNKRSNYDVPILGNAISFREAHTLMSSIDPVELENRRNRAAQAVGLL
jgi:phosphomannomutase